MTEQGNTIEYLLREERRFPPSEAFKQQANINDPAIYEKAARDPQAFWENWAKQLRWDKPWKKTLDWNPPYARWFVDGQINACVAEGAVAVRAYFRHPRAIKFPLEVNHDPRDRPRLLY